MYLKQKYQIHFVGIGGVGMSGIARLLVELGYEVTGSDIKYSKTIKCLKMFGVVIFFGHKKEHVQDANLLVISSAISNENLEVKAAIERKIPVISRAKMLAELMRRKYNIAVSGMHGKTSTTALIGNLLGAGNFDPTIVLGGIMVGINSNIVVGRGDFMVAEVDESDGSLLEYFPTIAIVTNIDREHLDFYDNLEAVKDIFSEFLNRIPFYGTVILCLDDKVVKELVPEVKGKILTYGINSVADLKADNIRFKGMNTRFEVSYLGVNLGEIGLKIPGLHNVYNALAAIAVGLELGITFDVIKSAMGNAVGVQRRMELRDYVNKITLMDDYAHHPTEISATLKAINESWPNKRKIVVFQPHRYSRMRILFDEFIDSLYLADVLIIVPVYSAGEKSDGKFDNTSLCNALKLKGHRNVTCVDDFSVCCLELKNVLNAGDFVVTMGAGDVCQVGTAILEMLK